MNTNSGRACEREGDWERCELYSWLNGLVNVSWFLMIRVLCTKPMTSSGRGARTGRGEEYGSKSEPFALMSLVRGLAEFTVVRMAWVRLRREEKNEREGGREEVSALVSDALNSTRSVDGWVRLRLRLWCRCWCIIPLPFWLIDASANVNGKSCSVRWLRMFLSRKTPLQLNISRRDEAETATVTETVTGKMKMRE